MKNILSGAILSLLVVCAQAGPARAADTVKRPLVMLISIDGLKPEAVLEAQSHGLVLPNLRAFLKDGAYADGVRGVLPTLTYPSHTTLLTGASPARHGIYANTTFDPLRKNERGWYWYAEDMKAMSLWDAVADAHLRSANIYWPVSVGANITYNLPQIWRTGTDDDLKLQRALATPGLEQQLVALEGPYPGGMQETVAEDETRARFAIRLLETRHPDFMTVYLTGLDTEQHASGPFSAASNAVLQRLDAVVGRLRAAATHAAGGLATVCVVSDHGFAPVEHDVNLYAAFLQAGLFSADAAGQILSWKAMPWPAGGAMAVMLADPADATVKGAVAELLERLAADPENGIDRVLGSDELREERGFPDAAYFVSFKVGYELGYQVTGPIVSKPLNLGMHGYRPELPEMRSSFFIVGPHVTPGRALGDIDMRRIAPTLAAVMHLHLRDAELPALELQSP